MNDARATLLDPTDGLFRSQVDARGRRHEWMLPG